MSEETATTTVNAVKTVSDGMVKITVEKYNELLEKAAAKPPVINQRVVHKTTDILAREHRVGGVTFMGLGAALCVVGAIRYRAGKA